MGICLLGVHRHIADHMLLTNMANGKQVEHPPVGKGKGTRQ